MKTIENLQEILEKEFKWFHQHPELSLEEYETSRRIKEILKRENIEILDVPLKTGVVAVIRGQESGPVVAIRGDIDALPVYEETNLSYKSKVDGKMHACGHDYHLTSIIGTALLLRDNADKIKGTVKLVFQPAEEVFAGALQIMESGVLDDVELIFGIHCTINFPVGTVGIREGSVSAAVDRFKIELKGFGTHAAHPELGKDPIVAGSTLVNSLQTIVSRNIDPFSVGLVSITHFSAGNTWNVIPEKAFIEGTVRTLDKEQRKFIKERVLDITKYISSTYQVNPEIEWITGPPAANNDKKWSEFAKKVALDRKLAVEPSSDTLGGEDFAFYQEKIKGVFIHIGTDESYPNHHPKFKINPKALSLTSEFLSDLLIKVTNTNEVGKGGEK